MSDAPLLLGSAAAFAVLLGAALQRLSGSGVGLVVSAVLTVLLGPVSGVLLTNAAAVVSAAVILVAVRRRIEWRRAGILLAAAVPGALLGAWLVRALPAGPLSVLVGTTVLAGLGAVLLAERLPEAPGRPVLALAGAAGGLGNAVAGVAAPALVIAARLLRWPHAGFAATMQPVFLGMGLLSIGGKLLLGTGIAPPPWWMLPITAAAALAGLALGARLEGRLSMRTARGAALVLAALGAVLAILRGAAAW
ncbi:MAG: TSUP family transporter [Pseudoclavibacter sp.]|nr:TSUP family transporter [Pseudoclavibacter sp.]